MGRTGKTRRHALIAAGAATAGLLTACSTDTADGHTSGGPAGAAARAESALRLRSAGTSRELLGRYDAVLKRHPDRSGQLTPLRAAVARHVSALSPETRPGTPSPAVSTASAGTAARGSSVVADDPAEALRALAAAERRTADAHTAALMEAPPELARLLASLAAASAAHAYLLTEGSRS
ncbi:hypothetical protein [Streptomyces sp. AK02-01A]|uniref:hypothetical protein n=1 Tax=Streptomyces sp. AK02-01A TaxID=3028648 RepID=UPI0029A9620E|nr:hypothetical protein [Streptomyces sp. AK02-01A]MDX3855804.1 hypothetical protein [Streptomyces sp. AK02-01A]